MTAQRKATNASRRASEPAINTAASDAASGSLPREKAPEDAPRKAGKSAPAKKAVKGVNAKSSAQDKAPKPEKAKSKKPAAATAPTDSSQQVQVLDSQIAYEGPLFRVFHDHIIEPGGRESHRDVIRHNGSVVILAVDPGKRKKDPWIVVERQFRYAAGQFLWELPAGKLDPGEQPIEGARRELAEETGYSARKWAPLIDYFASPGFLGESMKVFLAEGLIPGDAHPEEDERIDFRLVRLSELLSLIDKGGIKDGKTIVTVLLYARRLDRKKKK